jgi:hypothetical protein
VKKIKGTTRHAMKIQMNVVAINGLRQGVAFLFFFIFFWGIFSLWNFGIFIFLFHLVLCDSFFVLFLFFFFFFWCFATSLNVRKKTIGKECGDTEPDELKIDLCFPLYPEGT